MNKTPTDISEKAINTLRFLAIDAVERAKSGHPGMPMGMASPAYVLWTQFLKHNPGNPDWANRDRFILSAGHGSMLLYSLLHLTGYDVSLADLKNFRQWESKTPGHPELGVTPGVETTTGPLGQGISTAVGMAIGQKYLNSLFSKGKDSLLDYKIYGIASDGDLMEGVSSEAASLAGHLGLGQIIFLYDDNRISIDGSTDLAFSEDVAARFKAFNWHVQRVEYGNDQEAVAKAIKEAQKETTKPSLVVVRTHIGFGSPNKMDSAESHGAPLGPEETKLTKENLGWPLTPEFFIPEEVAEHFREALANGAKLEKNWNEKFKGWASANPIEAALWERLSNGQLPKGWESKFPDFSKEENMATRQASGKIINSLAGILPELIGGSADLAPSNNTFIKGAKTFSKTEVGPNLHFGVREHAMGTALNGMALTNMLMPYGGTFLIFADYMKPAIRIAGINHKKVIYIFTHDTIGLGEDGPTHQPIEQVIHLRATPNVTVIRPADATETAAAWKWSLEHKGGPVALILSRQNLPVLHRAKYPSVGSVEKGAYILAEAKMGKPDLILIATGSEVSLALSAKDQLEQAGMNVRVVSMPSWEIFENQTEAYRQSVLPLAVKKRIAIEALSVVGWERYVGLDGEIIGMKTFGASAPGPVLMEKFGFTVSNIVARSKKLLGR